MENFTRLKSRLTLIYTAVLASLAVLSVIVLYIAIWASFEATGSENLELSARQLANAYDISEREKDDERNLNSLIKSLNDDGTMYRIWNEDFKIVRADQNIALDEKTGFYLVEKLFKTKTDGSEITNFDTGSGSYKICTSAYVTGSGRLITIQLVKNMSELRQALEGPMTIIVLIILTGIILSYLLGNFLAGRALAPIKETYEQQRNFLADASHELRTPVAVVLANLEAIKAHPDSTVESQMKWVENAHSEIVLTKGIIENLLFLAKADAGQTVSEFEAVDISYMILEVSERLTGLAESKGVELITNISDFELYVMGDQKRLTELVTILIDNAVKYTNAGGSVHVDVSANASTVKVQIRDTGIGISKEEQEKIFNRFYRVDKARSRSASGTGLGLSIANTIVQEHKIELSLESTEGEGSCFSLEFNRIYPENSEAL